MAIATLKNVSLVPRPPLPAALQRALYMSEQPKAAAVAVCLRKKNGRVQVLLIKRASQMRDSPKSISFPGGGVERENDPDLEACAARELGEEVGIKPGLLTQVLTPVATADDKYIMTPVVYDLDLSQGRQPLQLNEEEIKAAFWVDLVSLVRSDSQPFNCLSLPVQAILIETKLRLVPSPYQAPTPASWFASRNSYAYMWQDFGFSVDLLDVYDKLLLPAPSLVDEATLAMFNSLKQSHRRQIRRCLRLLPRVSTDYVYRGKSREELVRLLEAIGVDFKLDKPKAGAENQSWQGFFLASQLFYARKLEQYLGLRRVDHVEAGFETSQDFWRIQRYWSLAMKEAYFNIMAIAKLCDEVNEQQLRNLFSVEAEILLA